MGYATAVGNYGSHDVIVGFRHFDQNVLVPEGTLRICKGSDERQSENDRKQTMRDVAARPHSEILF
jgi:hypothetical protein